MTVGDAGTGGIHVFASLSAIVPGREQALRAHLRALQPSPFAAVPGTHYARWLVLSELPYEGPPQKPDVLKGQYLLFSTCFDGADVDAHLARLQSGLGRVADEVWGHCVGYRGITDLPRYLRHNQLEPSAVFTEYPTASAAEVQAALDLRNRLVRFVVDHQGIDAGALRRAWKSEFPTASDGGAHG